MLRAERRATQRTLSKNGESRRALTRSNYVVVAQLGVSFIHWTILGDARDAMVHTERENCHLDLS
jgi:hypothetical protein